MEEKTYADQILDGDVECSSCSQLNSLRNDVEDGRLSVEEFRDIVNAAKKEILQKTV